MTRRHFVEAIITLYAIYFLGGLLIFGSVALYQDVFGQQSTTTTKTPPITPTITNTPTPTSPDPNFQYLPQKAAVQVYTPEVGIPQNVQPLQVVPQVIPVQQQGGVGGGGFDVGSILSMVVAAGSGLFAKMGFDKAKKVQDTTKENSTAIVDTKIVQQELARLLFDWNKEKSEALNNSPSTKLSNLEAEKKSATETAAKA